MAKARETYAHHAPIVDADRNQAITDYITRGQVIYNDAGDIDGFVAMYYTLLTMWPYNPGKSLFDRMSVHGRMRYFANVGNDVYFEYTLDSGVSWVQPAAGGALIYTTEPPTGYGGTIKNYYFHVPLDGILTAEWLGLRIIESGSVPTPTLNVTWTFIAFLWNSTEDPF